MKRLTLLVLVVMLLALTVLPITVTQASPNNGGYGHCTCKAYYTVKRGDILSKIAAYYGVSTKSIQNCNNIANRNYIYPGQVLCIPGTPPPPAPHPPAQPPGYYPPPPQPGDGPATACAITPVLGFGQVWYNNQSVRDKLGCPIEPEKGFNAIEQGFQYGYVVNNQDTKNMYILFGKVGKWTTMPDTWVNGDPISNPSLIPPYGYYQPEYGIGKMWRNEDNFSQRLGWAIWPQRPVAASAQKFEHGEMLWTATNGIYALYDSDSYRHVNP